MPVFQFCVHVVKIAPESSRPLDAVLGGAPIETGPTYRRLIKLGSGYSSSRAWPAHSRDTDHIFALAWARRNGGQLEEVYRNEQIQLFCSKRATLIAGTSVLAFDLNNPDTNPRFRCEPPNGKRKRRWGGPGTRFARILHPRRYRQKCARIPTVRCTPCWAALVEDLAIYLINSSF